jgi:hypothetical protein
MIETPILNDMINTPAECDLGYDGCEGTATQYIDHPTGEALGEDTWGMVWVCDGPCAYQAARES